MSEHFSVAELCRSAAADAAGLANTPSEAQVSNLCRLMEELLEPVRALLGVPLRITSGYRSHVLNEMVGGMPNSAHLDGRAADFIPSGFEIAAAFDAIKNQPLPFDQLISEHSVSGATWLHIAIAPEDREPRREAFHLLKRDRRVHFG